ncbi:multidrug ABC transporter ATP-binding protein [Pacificimonas flava]|uniref:Multidrug ABC transporter ATP-binding protein n=2 Tax=Pacificimonas TaxID=1960290 RepID=A0A219B8Y6_9SPHN|nr:MULTISPECIES: ABC transporter ATP-binding protein [Pacificimonas]MBZ6377513.1 ABC transporter ATP-binding protein [Pacificimonas aurantium]OWV34634.1 multidrug ABC transporter ATP-binding protein [Pacificimonas flava]
MTARTPAAHPPAASAAIEIRDLEKTYSDGKRALKGVSFDVPRGSIFGLLGPNGAGKSTLINILAGLVNKTGGTARIWGFDIDADRRNAKRAIGIVPQEVLFDAFFTPRETMELQAGMYGIAPKDRRTMEILNAVRLGDKADAYSRTLSGGMKRRLLIAKALVHDPPILILDEPTAGVDIELRQQLWTYVREMHAAGTTIVLTTHYLEEAEELCDRIAIINHGEVVANDETGTLLKQAREKVLIAVVDRDLSEVPEGLPVMKAELKGARELVLTYDRAETGAGRLLTALSDRGLTVEDVSTREADLEDVFLHLTKSGAIDSAPGTEPAPVRTGADG